MKIRIAQVLDAEVLRNLMEFTFRDTYSEFNTLENMENHVKDKFDIEKVKNELQNTDYQYFVVENENEIIAYSKLVLNHFYEGLGNLKPIEIEKFYVKPGFKGMKIGQNLMDFSVNWSKQQGFEVLWLGVWENNPNAMAFYEKMGFEKFGNHVFLLGDDIQNDFVMKKMIS